MQHGRCPQSLWSNEKHVPVSHGKNVTIRFKTAVSASFARGYRSGRAGHPEPPFKETHVMARKTRDSSCPLGSHDIPATAAIEETTHREV